MLKKSAFDALNDQFAQIEDPRVDRCKKYSLSEILFICATGTLCGCQKWTELQVFASENLFWLRKYLPFPNGTPSHDTISRVMSLIAPRKMGEVFFQWSMDFFPEGTHIAFDGKTLKGTADHDTRALHIVHAFEAGKQVLLGQVKTDEKSNEITAFPELINLLELDGCVVTIDAMGAHTEVAKALRKKNADYILGLKKNRRILYEEAELLSEKVACIDRFEEPIVKDHGRIERRICRVMDARGAVGAEAFPDARSLVRVDTEKEIIRADNVVENQHSTRYYVSSLNISAEAFCRYIRAHWAIENNLHWILDVVFNEDQSQTRNKIAAENFSTIRKIVMQKLKEEDSKLSMQLKIKKAIFSQEFRDKCVKILFNL